MRFSFSKASTLIIGLAIVSNAGEAEANLIFDRLARGFDFQLDYSIEGQVGVATIDPINLLRTSHVESGELLPSPLDPHQFLLSFFEANNVSIGIVLEGDLPVQSLSPVDVFLLDVPVLTMFGSFYRVDLSLDTVVATRFGDVFFFDLDGDQNLSANVLVETPRSFVMEIFASASNSPDHFLFTGWSGEFTIRATRTPEPAAVSLLAGGLIACAASRWRGRGR